MRKGLLRIGSDICKVLRVFAAYIGIWSRQGLYAMLLHRQWVRLTGSGCIWG